jgi:hypothetical protein
MSWTVRTRQPPNPTSKRNIFEIFQFSSNFFAPVNLHVSNSISTTRCGPHASYYFFPPLSPLSLSPFPIPTYPGAPLPPEAASPLLPSSAPKSLLCSLRRQRRGQLRSATTLGGGSGTSRHEAGARPAEARSTARRPTRRSSFPWRQGRRSKRLEVCHGHGRSSRPPPPHGPWRSRRRRRLELARCLEQRRSGAGSRRGRPPPRHPSPCSHRRQHPLSNIFRRPFPHLRLRHLSHLWSRAPSLLYCLSMASAAASLLASSGWDGARACGPAATSARPSRMGRRRIWRPRSRTEQSRRVWRPSVQPKSSKSDLEVALLALSRPPVRTVLEQGLCSSKNRSVWTRHVAGPEPRAVQR